MHELAICQSLLREVERAAHEHGAQAVTAIFVTVGPLSGVEPALLARAFSVARVGTIADEAQLEIRESGVTVWCDECQQETVVAANALVCGKCQGWQVRLRSGDELLLQRLILATDPAAA